VQFHHQKPVLFSFHLNFQASIFQMFEYGLIYLITTTVTQSIVLKRKLKCHPPPSMVDLIPKTASGLGQFWAGLVVVFFETQQVRTICLFQASPILWHSDDLLPGVCSKICSGSGFCSRWFLGEFRPGTAEDSNRAKPACRGEPELQCSTGHEPLHISAFRPGIKASAVLVLFQCLL
jgi:hypothetical protein